MEDDDAAGGHDAPNWSRVKSASVLMGCTVLYAIIAGAFLSPPLLRREGTDARNRNSGRCSRCSFRWLGDPRETTGGDAVCVGAQHY